MKEKKLKSLSKYLLTALLVIICTNLNFSASKFTSITVDDYWYNFPSSPLKINIERNKTLFTNEYLENVSKVKITGYQLGCVSEKKDFFEIIRENIEEIIEIDSSDSKSSENILYLPKSSHGTYLSICSFPTKVSVIKVNFVDGGVWMVKK